MKNQNLNFQEIQDKFCELISNIKILNPNSNIRCKIICIKRNKKYKIQVEQEIEEIQDVKDLIEFYKKQKIITNI